MARSVSPYFSDRLRGSCKVNANEYNYLGWKTGGRSAHDPLRHDQRVPVLPGLGYA